MNWYLERNMSLEAARYRAYKELGDNKERISKWEREMGEQYMQSDINDYLHYIYAVEIIWDKILYLGEEVGKNYYKTVYIGKKTIKKSKLKDEDIIQNPYADGYLGSHPIINKIRSLCIKHNKPFEEVFTKRILFISSHYKENKIVEGVYLEWAKKRIMTCKDYAGIEFRLLNSNRAGNGGDFHCNPELVEKCNLTRKKNNIKQMNREYHRRSGFTRGKTQSSKVAPIYVGVNDTDEFEIFPTQLAAACWFDDRLGLAKSDNGSSKSNYYVSKIVNGEQISSNKYKPYTIIKADGDQL